MTHYCPVCKAKKDFRRYQHGSWFVFKCETCQLDLQEAEIEEKRQEWLDDRNTTESSARSMR